MRSPGKESTMLLSRRAFLGSSLSTLTVAVLAPVQTWPRTASADDAGGDWPLFRGDASRTAATTEPGPPGSLAPLWVFTSDAIYPSNPIVVGDSLFVLGGDDILWALDRASGAQRWAIVLGGSYSDGYHSVPAFAGGTLYCGSATGFLFAFDPATGAEKWRYPTGDVIISPPLAVDGVVYVGSNDGFVYAVDGASGTLRWKSDTGPIFAASPALAGDGLYVGADDGTLFCLDAATGAQRWTFATERKIKTSAVAGGIVYVPSGDGRLYALDTATGEQRWASADVGPATVNNPSVLGDIVVVTIDNVGVFAFDAQTGAQRWERTDFADTGISSSVIAGDVVYVSVHDKDFDTLDLATGETIASYELGRFAGAPALADGVLYIFDDGGTGYAFAAAPAGVATPIPLPPPVVGTMPTSAPLSQLPEPGVPSVGTLVKTIAFANGSSDPLKGPEGIAFGQDGRMYLIDSLNDRIVVYDKTGNFLTTIGTTGTRDGEFAFSTPDKLGYAGDLTIGPDGSLYVCDFFNGRVQRLAADGNHLSTVGLGEGALPASAAVDTSAARLYISDIGSGQILLFDLDLAPLGALGPASAPVAFETPFELVVAGDGSLWIAEYDASAIKQVDSDGQQLARIGRYGVAGGRFIHTVGVAFDVHERIYAGDYGSGRIQIFDPNGKLIAVVGSKGAGDDQFSTPTYLAFGPDGLLYVSDDTANRVLVFSIQLPA
jgi:outer membrane protein assembly factor BamB